jgi:hypothetical protein
MPKADATGLAPEKSAEPNPPPLSSGVGGFFVFVLTHFYGEVSERRPWVFKRDDRPKGVPNSSPSVSAGYVDDHREAAKLNGK